MLAEGSTENACHFVMLGMYCNVRERSAVRCNNWRWQGVVTPTRGGQSPFHRAWQIHIFKQLAKSVSLTVRPGCGTNFKQLTGGGRESAPVLPSETRPRILGACPRHQTRKQTRTQNKRNKRGILRPVLSQIFVAYPQSKTLWCSSVADETSDLKSG